MSSRLQGAEAVCCASLATRKGPLSAASTAGVDTSTTCRARDRWVSTSYDSVFLLRVSCFRFHFFSVSLRFVSFRFFVSFPPPPGFSGLCRFFVFVSPFFIWFRFSVFRFRLSFCCYRFCGCAVFELVFSSSCFVFCPSFFVLVGVGLG